MKTAGFLLAGILFVLLVFIIILSFYKSDYAREEIIFKSPGNHVSSIDTIHVMSWNIGYAGLDETMDFFYDGGEQVRTSKKRVHENMNNIISFLCDQKKDIYLLQEIDKNSKRSRYTNQVNMLSKRFLEYYSAFAMNYKTWYVPLPLGKPLGRVNSGLLTLSRNMPSTVVRHNLPGKYPWPKRLFMPQRCMLASHYKLTNKKELIIINTHLSAFDQGVLKKQEMEYIKNYTYEMYNKGHYIIIGGDWNQSPPGIQSNFKNYLKETNLQHVPENYFPDEWKWAYDSGIPTNRSLKTSFDKIYTKTSVLDFFLTSPNVEIMHVQTIDLGFKYSDHHPVVASFVLSVF